MKNYPSEIYYLYWYGCKALEWQPMSEGDFWPAYRRYRRLLNFLTHFEHWEQRYPERKQKSERRRQLLKNAQEECKPLHKLYEAIHAGQSWSGYDGGSHSRGGDGGAGFPVSPLHGPPTLSGAAAKLLPHLDPEPEFRDP